VLVGAVVVLEAVLGVLGISKRVGGVAADITEPCSKYYGGSYQWARCIGDA